MLVTLTSPSHFASRARTPMHVTLIDPPRYTFPLNHASNVAIPPLGVAYIAASIESAGHQLSVIDAVGEGLSTYTPFGSVYLRGLPFDEVVRRIDPDTRVIAMSNMFSCQWPATHRLIARIRERFPDTPIVIGGEHPTGMPELTLTQSRADFVVRGEGEETMLELLEHLGGGAGAPDGIAGLAFRRNGDVVLTPRRDRMRQIDDIPTPAWRHFNVEGYIGFNQPHGASLGRYIPMLATRGCPYRCTFCTSPQMWTQFWIMRDPVRIVDEMQSYMEQYGATDFHFEDLTALVRKDKVLALAQAIIDRGLKVTFQLPSGTRSEAVDRETARALKAAGCSEFQFAPESGDERVLKAIEKRVALPRMFESARCAIDEGMSVSCNFIFGFPEDDWRSVLNNYKAIVRCAWLGFTGVNLNAYSPQPNTTSFKALVAEGRIPEFDDAYFMSLFTFQSFFVKKTSYNPRFSAGMLTAIILFGFALFYGSYFLLRPTRIIGAVRSLFTRTAVNKSATYGRSMVREIGRVRRFRKAARRSGAGLDVQA